jgi:DNA-binding LacI/PurR family transcriptional regulator
VEVGRGHTYYRTTYYATGASHVAVTASATAGHRVARTGEPVRTVARPARRHHHPARRHPTWCHPLIAANSRSSRPVSGAASSRARKVTSVDVAKKAGVSQTTVSLVFSGKASGRISEATADAVRAAARELGYRPNAAARALRSGTASAVGLVVRDVTHPFFGRTLRGAQKAASEAGHVVVLIDDNYGRGDAAVEALRDGAIDGFLYFAALPSADMRGPGAPPVVMVESEQPGLPFVRLDAETGTDAAMEHLHQLGHTRIGALRLQAGAETGGQTFDRRHERWAAHLRAHGEDPDAMAVGTTTFDAESTIAAARALLQRPDRPTAFLCDDDLLAAGMVAAARELGLRVPHDVAVVGFDDLELARLTSPPLTTVAFDPEALGAAAFEMLLAKLQGRRPKNRVLPSNLIVRGSTVAE